MIYTEADVDFNKLTALEFENLCYEILPFFGFSSIIWRQGGADNGRDIEAKLLFQSSFISDHYTKWFLECKHYTNGVPPEQLNSKIAWADAERPDFFCILTSSYITNAAHTWLEALRPQKSYKIFVIDGAELKKKLVAIQSIIPKYFSENKFVKLFEDSKRLRLLYNVRLSFEMIETIISNIPVERFNLNDIGFLVKSFYENYREMETAGNYSGNFDPELPLKFLPRLKQLSNQVDITNFVQDIQFLGGSGFVDDSESEEINDYIYQEYVLHLNFSDEPNWDIGNYILVIVDKTQAFELFFKQKTGMETYSFFYDNVNEQVLDEILLKFYDVEAINNIKKFSKGIN